MGSGSGVGGGMLRTLGKVSRVSVARNGLEPSPSSPTSASSDARLRRKVKSSRCLSLVSSPDNNSLSGIPIWGSERDEHEWISVDGIENERADGVSDHHVFGSVPSEDEVEDVVYAFQQVFGPSSHVQQIRGGYCSNDVADQLAISTLFNQVSLNGSEIDWVEPSLSPYISRTLQRPNDAVSHAFHLLRTEPSIQRMVKSLSSDSAVWDAVMNNEAVKELRESLSLDEELSQKTDEDSDNDYEITSNIVMKIFHSAKGKFMEVIEKIIQIVNELFQFLPGPNRESHNPLFNERLRASFMLSILVLLVVVVRRSYRT